MDFDGFVADNVERLLRTAYLITWDEGEAEDLVQECLLKVARRWPRVRGWRNRAPTHGGSSSTSRSTAPAAAPGAAASSTAHPRSLDEPAQDALADLETRAELLDALGRLTPRQRAVLVLRYFNDLTETQAAELLGCSPGTVKSNASRGLARLREAFAPIPQPNREL